MNAQTAKITPGQWKEYARHGKNEIMIVASGHHIASVPIDEDEDSANARLIAAAPELLGALRFIIDLLPADPGGAINVARAAIAKAVTP